MTESEKWMERADSVLLHVYSRFPVVFDHGEGMTLYDIEGKSYLDFASGIGVNAFGTGDPEYLSALFDQMKKIMHTSNLYYHKPLVLAAEALTRVSGMDQVFFTNSGAEAIEGAIKTAKKYAFRRTKKNGHGIIAMQHSFHGRTVGAVSVTGTDHYREPFYPLMDGVKFAQFNDFSSVEAAWDDSICAVLIEPVQGEGGIRPADPEFLSAIRRFCDEKDILLIFDEVQCGMGRTGTFYTWQHYGVRPDILSTAKGLGGGVPVGAFAVTKQVAEQSLEPGDHGSTYGGNPFVCAAVAEAIGLMEKRDLPGHVKRTAPYLEQSLDALVSDFSFIEERRGLGFMQGLQLSDEVSASDIVSEALRQGLLLLTAGGNVIRFLPPLIAQESDIDQMTGILRGVLEKVSN